MDSDRGRGGVLSGCGGGLSASWPVRSRQCCTCRGARSEKIIEINPKNVIYQLFGPPNTSGTISFLDGNSQPQTANFAALPWQFTVTTTLSAMVANIVAQGNSDSLGCRIIVNGDVRDQHASTESNAATYCLVKSA